MESQLPVWRLVPVGLSQGVPFGMESSWQGVLGNTFRVCAHGEEAEEGTEREKLSASVTPMHLVPAEGLGSQLCCTLANFLRLA